MTVISTKRKTCSAIPRSLTALFSRFAFSSRSSHTVLIGAHGNRQQHIVCVCGCCCELGVGSILHGGLQNIAKAVGLVSCARTLRKTLKTRATSLLESCTHACQPRRCWCGDTALHRGAQCLKAQRPRKGSQSLQSFRREAGNGILRRRCGFLASGGRVCDGSNAMVRRKLYWNTGSAQEVGDCLQPVPIVSLHLEYKARLMLFNVQCCCCAYYTPLCTRNDVMTL